MTALNHSDYVYGQVYAEHTAAIVHVELEATKKRLTKLMDVMAFVHLQVSAFAGINCFVANITRYKDNRDDIAIIVIKSDGYERFAVCINTKNDFKVMEIAYKVHNLHASRRKTLVNALRKCEGTDAHYRTAMLIHRARNFEIRKV